MDMLSLSTVSNVFNNSSESNDAGRITEIPVESIPLYIATNYLWYICSPVIIILGLFGNVMTIVITRTMTSGESTVNLYFTSMAVTDLLVLVSASLKEWLSLTFGFQVQDLNSFSCKLFVWLSTGSGTISCWLLVCLTLHRAMSVVWPHRVSLLCTRRTVIVLITGIAGFLAILYSHYLFGFDLVHSNNGKSQRCAMPSGPYMNFVQNVFAYIELALYSLLPFAVLVLANGVLVYKLAASVRQAHRLSQARGTSDQFLVAREKAANSVTLTVVVVSLTFICLTLPTSVNYTLYYFAREYNQVSGHDYVKVHLFYTVSYLLADLNSAVNFYLYCLTGYKFRTEFVRLVCCRGRGIHSSSKSVDKMSSG